MLDDLITPDSVACAASAFGGLCWSGETRNFCSGCHCQPISLSLTKITVMMQLLQSDYCKLQNSQSNNYYRGEHSRD